MISWDLKLVAKIIQDKDMKTAIKEKISSEILHNAEAKIVFDYITEAYQSTGKVPTIDMVHDVFPRIPLPDKVQDDLPILCEHVRKGHLASELKRYSLEISELSDSSPEEAAARLAQASSRLCQISRVGDDLVLSQSIDEFRKNYTLNQRLRRQGKAIGIEYPWESLTKESMGMLPGEFILLFGQPKSKKTFLTCYMAGHTYFHRHKRVLFFTKEMTPQQVQARVLCSIAKINYGLYKRGELDAKQEDAFFSQAQGLKVHERKAVSEHGGNREADFIIASDMREEGGGVSSICAMIEQYEPDVVFIDGIYLMRDDRKGERSRDWHNVSNITSDIKLMARRYKIPIVGNTQATPEKDDRRKGSKLSSIAYSSSFSQDADLVLHVDPGFEEDGSRKITLTVAGAREFAMEALIIGGDACTDFEERRVIMERGSLEEDSAAVSAEAATFAQTAKLEAGNEMRSYRSRGLPPHKLAGRDFVVSKNEDARSESAEDSTERSDEAFDPRAFNERA